MAVPRVLVMRAPGTNCDFETAYAFEKAGAEPTLAHINQFIGDGLDLAGYQILVFPGGFTYGDDLGAGKIMGNELSLKLGAEISRFTGRGGLVLGICNGFQLMVKSGILPGNRLKATLTTNDSGRFECRWIHLRVNPDSNCVFTRGIRRLYLPVANGEGKLIADSPTLEKLNAAVHYYDPSGNEPAPYPENPSGSMAGIAGLSDSTGRIFALMPHPERHIRPDQHPGWTRGQASKTGDGLAIFINAVEWVKHL